MNWSRREGYSLVDVLVAIVILGVATVAIFMSVAAGRAALVKATHRTWATVLGATLVTERDLGLERSSHGQVEFPLARTTYRWTYVDDVMTEGNGTGGPVLEVSWGGDSESEKVVVRGFVNPNRRQ